MTEGRTSVLAKLTADIMSEKKVAARVLTPVEGEARPSLKEAPPLEVLASPLAGLKGDVFPHDGGITESVRFSMTNIRDNLSKIAQYSAMIEECLQSIEREAGAPVGGVPKRASGEPTPEELEQKEKERTADEKAREQQKFADDLAAKTKAAQEQAFPEPEAGFWVCPDHGKVTDKVSAKTGRAYRGCPDCNRFER